MDKNIEKAIRVALVLGKTMEEINKMTPVELIKFINTIDTNKLNLGQVILLSNLENKSLLVKLKNLWKKLKLGKKSTDKANIKSELSNELKELTQSYRWKIDLQKPSQLVN